jgi:hypothetical protein
MSTIYDRLRNGEVLRVQFKDQSPSSPYKKGPFTVQRLLVFGDYWTPEGSEWASLARVGGIRINRRLKERMSDCDIREWCELVQEVTMTPMGFDFKEISKLVEAEQQDREKITALVRRFNAHAEYGVMISIIDDPETLRIELVPMEKLLK